LKEIFKQKTVAMLKLSADYSGQDALHQLLDSLNRAPKQQELVLAYMSLFPGVTGDWELVSKKSLLENLDHN